MKNKSNKIAITTSSFGKLDKGPLEKLEKAGFEVFLNPYGRVLKENEITDLLTQEKPLGLIAGTEPLNAKVLSKGITLKGISRVGVGMDNVDLSYTQSKGIVVKNTPQATILPVAELALGLILNLLRHVSELNSQVKSNVWKKKTGTLLYGKNVGIIGAGRIGKRLAEMLVALGCEVFIFDKHIDKDWMKKFNMKSAASIQELFGLADIISIHVSGGKDTYHLINKDLLREAKPNLLFINLSRGGVVDENDLAEVLKDKTISGAALDVFEEEPYSGPLKGFDNVILTPHIGSAAKEARVEMESQAVENLLSILRNQS